LIQVSGSGIASGSNWEGNQKDIGVHVLVAGLASQLLTTLVFLIIVGAFARRALVQGSVKPNAPAGWKNVYRAILVSIVLILVC
jgi:hypothetical protein